MAILIMAALNAVSEALTLPPTAFAPSQALRRPGKGYFTADSPSGERMRKP